MSDEALEQSMEVMRNVLPLMSQYGLPATPRNYAVLHGYVSAENSALRHAIDRHLDTLNEISSEKCEEWFNEYVSMTDESSLYEVQQEVKSIMENVVRVISTVSGRSDEYTNMLSNTEAHLGEEPSLSSLLDVISDLREETVSMRQSSEKMRGELNNKLDEVERLRGSLENIKREAGMDYLTGVANRKGLMESLPLLCKNSKGQQCFAMIDIDHFKQFNDNHGHIVGDKVLRFVANIIKDSIKGSDFIARYGGEEFIVVFTGTGIENATMAAENVRMAIEKTRFKLKDQNLGTISVSIGISEYLPCESYEECIERADKALYQSKDTGRNRVTANAVAA